MKKLLLLFLMPLILHGQPTLNSVPLQFGLTVTTMGVDSVDINFPLSGNNSWDFSMYPGIATFDVTMLDPATTPFAAQFPTANIAQGIGIGGSTFAYLYGGLTNDSLYALGAAGGISFTFSDPNVSLRFPLNLGDSFTDVSYSTQDGLESTIKTYVGWGDVTLPGGVLVPNCILLRDQTTDSNGVNIDYDWHAIANLSQAFHLDSSDAGGQYFVDPTVSSIGQQHQKDRIQFSVRPNPSDGPVTIEFTLEKSEHLQVEVIGVTAQYYQKLANTSFSKGTHKLVVNEEIQQHPGTYFIRISNRTTSIAEKLIIR